MFRRMLFSSAANPREPPFPHVRGDKESRGRTIVRFASLPPSRIARGAPRGAPDVMYVPALRGALGGKILFKKNLKKKKGVCVGRQAAG